MPDVLLIPDGDVGPNDGTAIPAGPHYLNLDDEPHDSSATVVRLSAGGDVEVLAWAVPAQLRGQAIARLTVRWSALKGGDPAAYEGRAGVRIAGVDYFGPTRALTDPYSTFDEVFTADLSGPGPWTYSRLVAANPVCEMVTVPLGLPRPRITNLVGLVTPAEPARWRTGRGRWA